ncbi:MAG: iron ABC transporter substrate-binding protein, partial [Candidatus Rokuibacteriota bacterium]
MMARWGLLLLVLTVAAVPVHAKDIVVIYTAIEPEQITDYMKAVNKTLPNLDVKMLRLSTGDISARFMAEKDN